MKKVFGLTGCASIELRQEPSAGGLPVAHHGIAGNVDHFGRFFDAQAAEKAEFDYLGLAGVDFGQRVESIIQGDQLSRSVRRNIQSGIQVEYGLFPAAFIRGPPAGMV